MRFRRTVRNLTALLGAIVALATAWSLHVAAQERPGGLGGALKRAAQAEEQQIRGAVAQPGAQPRAAAPRPGAQRRAAPRAAGHHAGHGQHDDCAQACSECQRICDSCAAHCLSQVAEGNQDHKTTVETCLDCAEICAAAARIVSRGGPFSETICRACAEACARCAESCEQIPDDQHMAECAKICRKCEQECRTMIGEEDDR